MLLKMPGIDLKNIHRIVTKVTDFKDLLSKSEKDLHALLENEMCARRLYDFLHNEHTRTEDAVSAKTNKRMPLNKINAGGKRKK